MGKRTVEGKMLFMEFDGASCIKEEGLTYRDLTAHPYLMNEFVANLERLSQILDIEKTVLPARFVLDTFVCPLNKKKLNTIVEI